MPELLQTRHLGCKQKYINGFTLIELLITISIIAILTFLAVSSYKIFSIKSNRLSAQAYLLRATTNTDDINNLDFSEIPYRFEIISKPPEYIFALIPLNTQSGDGALSIDYQGLRKHFSQDFPAGAYSSW